MSNMAIGMSKHLTATTVVPDPLKWASFNAYPLRIVDCGYLYHALGE